MNTDTELLAEAREAWRLMHWSRNELIRLKRYARMTDGMKHDQQRALRSLADSDATLRRILGSGANTHDQPT